MKDILSAMIEAVKLAKNEFCIFYVYQNENGNFDISPTLKSDWLFKAYPGGRKVISIAGKERMNENDLSCIN